VNALSRPKTLAASIRFADYSFPSLALECGYSARVVPQQSNARGHQVGENKLSVVELGNLSEPASKLIDAVSRAFGVAYEPTRIRRRARADADAAIILAKTQIEIQGLERRAAERLIARELRRQHNIETIIDRAIDELPHAVSDEKVDEDWMIQFFDSCQDVSNDQMKQIWARLLAGEVARPGTFSPRALATVKLMQQEDAWLFERLCKYVWKLGPSIVPVLLSPKSIYVKSYKCDIEFGHQLHLEALGLLSTAGIGEITIGVSFPCAVEYFSKQYILTVDGSVQLPVGKALFTSAGEELSLVVQTEPDDIFRAAVLEFWQLQGIKVEEL